MIIDYVKKEDSPKQAKEEELNRVVSEYFEYCFWGDDFINENRSLLKHFLGWLLNKSSVKNNIYSEQLRSLLDKLDQDLDRLDPYDVRCETLRSLKDYLLNNYDNCAKLGKKFTEDVKPQLQNELKVAHELTTINEFLEANDKILIRTSLTNIWEVIHRYLQMIPDHTCVLVCSGFSAKNSQNNIVFANHKNPEFDNIIKGVIPDLVILDDLKLATAFRTKKILVLDDVLIDSDLRKVIKEFKVLDANLKPMALYY